MGDGTAVGGADDGLDGGSGGKIEIVTLLHLQEAKLVLVVYF